MSAKRAYGELRQDGPARDMSCDTPSDEPGLGNPKARQRGFALLAVETIELGGTRRAIGYQPGDSRMRVVHVLIYQCE